MSADFLGSTLAHAVHALDAGGAPYAIIGGIAAIARGSLRFTHDLDVAVAGDAADVAGLLSALRSEGFSHDPASDRMQLGDITLFRFWRPHDEVSVDVGVDLQVASTALFASIAARATSVDLFGCSVPVASTEDLIVLKLLSFRPIDRGDAIDLSTVSASLDWSYIEAWCRRLDLMARLEEVQEAIGRG